MLKSDDLDEITHPGNMSRTTCIHSRAVCAVATADWKLTINYLSKMASPKLELQEVLQRMALAIKMHLYCRTVSCHPLSLTFAMFSGVLAVFVGPGRFFFVMDPVYRKMLSHLKVVVLRSDTASW